VAESRRETPTEDIEEISEAGLTTLEQSFRVDHPPDAVWAFFGDLPRVARCMPGAAVTKVEGERVEGEIHVKLGPITSSFAGQGRTTRDDTARRATIVGQGRDSRSGSRARGRVVYRVREGEEGGTRVEVEVGFALAGMLAQFSRGGIVTDLANRLTQAFAENLAAELAGGARREGAEAGAPGPAPALDARALVLPVLWQRFKAALARLFGRR
jgi:carbon-monoxide dehydrogenase small subunit